MFFYLSKILFFVIRPTNFLIILLGLGLVLQLTRWRRTGMVAAASAFLGLAVLGFSPAANLLLQPLEDRFPRPDTPPPVDGIIVLGGAVDTVTSGARGVPALTTSAERLTTVAGLARKLPTAKIIHTGGQGLLVPGQTTESAVAVGLFTDFGIDPERIVLEDKSRNTWENAVLTRELVKPEPGQTWLLVTSAYHMPRAISVFREAGWSGLTAWPVDYRTRGPEGKYLGFSGASEGLKRFDIAFREWVGLAAYRLTGRSKAFFPAP